MAVSSGDLVLALFLGDLIMAFLPGDLNSLMKEFKVFPIAAVTSSRSLLSDRIQEKIYFKSLANRRAIISPLLAIGVVGGGDNGI